MTEVKIEESWKQALSDEFEKPYFGELSQFVKNEILAGQTIYPHPKNIFAALDKTPFEKVKVIILGQDPYHGPGQAHGLSFSVQEGVRNPPSLMNIFKEIQGDLSIPSPKNGDLSRWAEQGVLLLNTTLTVRAGQPMSHAGKGWETFTDSVIRTLSDKRDFLIFLLWGSHAQKKKSLIDTKKHIILEAPHPSPLSAHRGFLGCGH
ncbi:uracil-DNA glycosylase, partial [Candidatus Gracilibacteria bacterium]|nr:uracil-DNA glycosylase [Candidatus Gracilibacteria bacterium]